jgi:hypothetical protein
MIGQQVESRPSFPVAALLFLLAAVSLVVLGIAIKNPHPLMGAALPLCIGVALFWLRDRPFVAEFSATAIECRNPDLIVPYDSLHGLRPIGRSEDPRKPGPRAYPIHVIHEGGVFRIPKRLNVPSDDVYRFLYEQFPPEGERGVDPALGDYLDEQQKAFGPERVWSYRARSHLGSFTAYRVGRAVSLAVMVAGGAWVVLGLSLRFKDWGVWVGIGSFLVFFGFLFFMAFLASTRQVGRIKNWKQASLVISPVGMALVQGDIKGQMRWDELRDLQLKTKRGSFTMNADTAMPGIVLTFAGASVTIVDIYDQPLHLIFERIRRYWK